MADRWISDKELWRQQQDWMYAQKYRDLRKEIIAWFNKNPDITPPTKIVEIMKWRRRKRKE